MPIYEYKCPQCGNVFEEWVRSAEGHEHEPCPACSTPSPRKISRTAFVLKGDGWYVSDYGYRKGITEDDNKAGKSPAKSGTKSPAVQSDKTLAKTTPASPPAKKEASPAPAKSPESSAK